MRTLVDIPDDAINRLDVLRAAKGWSRAEAVRRAVNDLLEREAEAERAADKAAFDAAFGMWKDRGTDGLAYQQALRAEWDRPWDKGAGGDDIAA
jgi:Arc/MetJ-type ribon-helix-helix transcriptional regulator